MPAATVTIAQGDQPVIPADTNRSTLILQNNGLFDIRFRLYGPVSLSDLAKSGLVIQKKGGSVTITGPSAGKPVYALHTGTNGNQILDYESDS